MRYSLPKTVELGGVEYAIRSDYREILDILEMLADPELDNADKAEAMIEMFYVVGNPDKHRCNGSGCQA